MFAVRHVDGDKAVEFDDGVRRGAASREPLQCEGKSYRDHDEAMFGLDIFFEAHGAARA